MSARDGGLLGELLRFERGFWRMADQRQYYEDHFADEGIMVLPFQGGILNKQQTVDAVSASEPWTKFEITEPRILPIGEGCAALIYVALGERAGKPEYRAQVSSAYVRRGGSWQLLLHQQTPISS